MLATMRQRNFALLWVGGLISLAGDWMLNIALAAHVFELTGSALASGLMGAARVIPRLVLGSFAGVLVDRWDRRRTLVISNLLLAASLLPLLLARSVEWLWLVYLVAVAQSCLGQLVGPAENALLPQLVGPELLVSANAMNALNNNLARLIGPALGGLAAAALGLGWVAMADSATFLVAALLIAGIRLPPLPRAAGPPARVGLAAAAARLREEWMAGLRLVAARRRLAALFGLAALMSLGEGVMSALFVPFVVESIGGGAPNLGWLMSAQAIGGLLGGAAVAQYGARVRPLRLFGPSALLFGLIDLAIFNVPAIVPGLLPPLLLFILVGLPAAAMGASMMTLLQESAEDAYRGRVFGAFGAMSALLTLLGLVLGGALGDRVAIVPIINVQGYVHVLVGLLAGPLLAAETWRQEPATQRRSEENAGPPR
jgi:MFS family permease